MNVKNSIPQGRIWWLKLPVAPDNGDRHFSKLFNVEEIKGIIHSRIYRAGDVVQSVWHNTSAMIRYNCITKNYVIRKITSYIYLLIFTISIWLHVKHCITIKHEKGKCGKICFFVITGQDYLVNTSTSHHEKSGKYDSIGDKKKIKTCVRIK